MREYSTADLNKQVGEVTNAAMKAPVTITRHNKPRFVMMSYELYLEFKRRSDARRAYGAGETPPEVAAVFAEELDRLAKGQRYDDEP